MKLSIIIPVYNEEACIGTTLCELERYMREYMTCSSWEIITVNDGSIDKTLTILNTLKETRPWLKVVDLVKNYGRGKALRAGFEHSTGDIIVSLDADLSYAPYHIGRMIDKLIKTDADIVLASAYGKMGTVKNVPLIRLLVSRIGNKILSYTFSGNISVLTCIVRAYKRDFIKKLDLHSNDKDLHLEILHKAKILGGKIIEVPADLNWHNAKAASQSKAKKRRSTIAFRRTSGTHFFFAMLNKPGIIFFVPANVLLIISLIILSFILRVILANLASGMSLYISIRESMLSGMLSYMTSALSFILAIQFFSLGFLTNQNKKNYEETYKTNNAIFNEIKKNGDI